MIKTSAGRSEKRYFENLRITPEQRNPPFVIAIRGSVAHLIVTRSTLHLNKSKIARWSAQNNVFFHIFFRMAP
jgi:hypothetical protein